MLRTRRCNNLFNYQTTTASWKKMSPPLPNQTVVGEELEPPPLPPFGQCACEDSKAKCDNSDVKWRIVGFIIHSEKDVTFKWEYGCGDNNCPDKAIKTRKDTRKQSN
jgi:hypothetical protein